MSDTMYAAPAQTDRTGFATTALVLGIVGVVMAFIPIIGVIAFVLCPLAIIFGILGRRSTKSGQSTAGLACGIVGLCVSIAWAIIFGAAVASTSTQINHINSNLQTYNNCVAASTTLIEMNNCSLAS